MHFFDVSHGTWRNNPATPTLALTGQHHITQDAHLVEAKVVGRVTMEQLLADAPCRSALVQPIVDDDIVRPSLRVPPCVLEMPVPPARVRVRVSRMAVLAWGRRHVVPM